MSEQPAPPNPQILQYFAVAGPQFVMETDRAVIWRVQRDNGTDAALKIYKKDMDNEGVGFALLQHWNGRGVAHVYGITDIAALTEWLDGPSLGDIVRAGDDDTGTQQLVTAALALHQNTSVPDIQMDNLQDWFVDLMAATYANDCAPNNVATLRRATQLAQSLLDNMQNLRPLHGDFHHDNIKKSARGYLAFDAKGVLGDRHYELANAFRNPLGAEDMVMRPETVIRRARHWAAAFDTTPATLLSWAAAHSALSLAWTYNGVFRADQSPDLTRNIAFVDTLLTCHKAES